MIVDKEGGILGAAGTLIAESEFEWDGFSRVQPDGSSLTYVQTQDGLGDYRIPKPMETRMDGSRIPIDEVRTDVGAVRNDNCVWKKNFPGWFCEDITYQDLIYESMDEDHMRRRLSPVAIRSEGIFRLSIRATSIFISYRIRDNCQRSRRSLLLHWLRLLRSIVHFPSSSCLWQGLRSLPFLHHSNGSAMAFAQCSRRVQDQGFLLHQATKPNRYRSRWSIHGSNKRRG